MVRTYVITLLALCGYLSTIEATSYDTPCTAGNNECGTAVEGLYCDTTAGVLKCKCTDIYATGTAGDTTCNPKDCTADSDCPTDGECYAGKCRCKPGYHATNADAATACVAMKTGDTCSSGTLHCVNMAGAYCDSTTNKCKCGTIYGTVADGQTNCGTGTVCTLAVSGTDLCTALDGNSECNAKICACKAGYDIYGTSSKCASASSGMGVVYSASVLIVGIVASFLRM